jgi:hypothetical protein
MLVSLFSVPIDAVVTLVDLAYKLADVEAEEDFCAAQKLLSKI